MRITIKRVLAAVLIAAMVAAFGAPMSAATSKSSGLYAPIPYGSKMEEVQKNFCGGKFYLNVNAFGICGSVSSVNVKKYLGDEAYFKVTQNGTGKVMYQSQSGRLDNSYQVQVSSGLESYKHGSRYWLKPATYTVTVWCQRGKHSMNTMAGRPKKVQVCKFQFAVYERGFKK